MQQVGWVRLASAFAACSEEGIQKKLHPDWDATWYFRLKSELSDYSAGVSAASASGAASSAALAAAAAASSAFFLATASALAAFLAVSSSRRALAALRLASAKPTFMALILESLACFQASKRFCASSAENAPFLTPRCKCFMSITPSRERIVRTVSVGIAPLLIQ